MSTIIKGLPIWFPTNPGSLLHFESQYNIISLFQMFSFSDANNQLDFNGGIPGQ